MAYNEVYLRCPQLANASRVLGNLGDDVLSKITLKSGVGTIVESGSDDGLRHPSWALWEISLLEGLPSFQLIRNEQELSACSYNKELQVMQSQDGKLSLKEGHANVSDGLRVQQAMSRRAAAAEIAGIATFDALQKWHTYLLNTLTQQPPQGFTPVALEQLTAADKELDGCIPQGGCLPAE